MDGRVSAVNLLPARSQTQSLVSVELRVGGHSSAFYKPASGRLNGYVCVRAANASLELSPEAAFPLPANLDRSIDISAARRKNLALFAETGMVLHVKPRLHAQAIIDTSSIREAAIKVASLGLALNGLGRGLAALEAAAWNSRGLATGTGAGIGHVASTAEREALIWS